MCPLPAGCLLENRCMGLLATDGYKFSMAEAGWPLRVETFYYAHRKGGPAVVPFDARAEIEKLLPDATPEDYAFLASHEYEMGSGFKAAVTQKYAVTIRALPKGSWFLPREPVFSITGLSALASWLEPLALQLHYRIQVATLAITDPAALAGRNRDRHVPGAARRSSSARSTRWGCVRRESTPTRRGISRA